MLGLRKDNLSFYHILLDDGTGVWFYGKDAEQSWLLFIDIPQSHLVDILV